MITIRKSSTDSFLRYGNPDIHFVGTLNYKSEKWVESIKFMYNLKVKAVSRLSFYYKWPIYAILMSYQWPLIFGKKLSFVIKWQPWNLLYIQIIHKFEWFYLFFKSIVQGSHKMYVRVAISQKAIGRWFSKWYQIII